MCNDTDGEGWLSPLDNCYQMGILGQEINGLNEQLGAKGQKNREVNYHSQGHPWTAKWETV